MINKRDTIIQDCLRRTNGRLLPQMVFSHSWNEYFLFYPSAVIRNQFAEISEFLLRYEESNVVTVINLTTLSDDCAEVCFLGLNTTDEDYGLFLSRSISPIWPLNVYLVSSDNGGWCIYADGHADLGVFAVGQGVSKHMRSGIIRLLEATSMRDIVDGAVRTSFDFQVLLPEWKLALIGEL